LLLASYVWFTRTVVVNVRATLKVATEMFACLHLGRERAAVKRQVRLDLSRSIREQGVPLNVTDLTGTPTAHANLPFDRRDSAIGDDPGVRSYIPRPAGKDAPIGGVRSDNHGGRLVLAPAERGATFEIILH
jgi:hypothetical protein